MKKPLLSQPPAVIKSRIKQTPIGDRMQRFNNNTKHQPKKIMHTRIILYER